MFARSRGRGTFLRSNQPENWVGHLMGFSETIRDAGYEAGAKILQQGMTNRHDAAVREQLRRTRRLGSSGVLRLADDTPIAIEHAFYPPDIGLELEKRDLVSILMYRVFEDELGLSIKDAQQTISADLADASSAKLLGVKVGSPLARDRTRHLRQGRPRAGAAARRLPAKIFPPQHQPDAPSLTPPLTRTENMPNGAKGESPNILLILNDDMGFSDIGCYGGEIQTPNLDRPLRPTGCATRSSTTPRAAARRAPRCCTGLHPHQTGIGILTYSNGPEGYAGNLNKSCVTIAEALKSKNYTSYLSGKWHIASSLTSPTDAWPMQRGFDHFYGTIIGAGSFYHPNTLTRGNDNIEHEAVKDPPSSIPMRSATRRRPSSTSTRRKSPTRRSSSMSPTPRRTGRCMPMTRTSPSTRGASTPAGTDCARSASSGSSTTASSIRTGA